MYCPKCGAKVEDGASFCSNCGHGANAQAGTTVINIVNNAPVYVRKKKWVAFFLCLFFGIWGVHRFYVGKVGTGILWIFTMGCFGIGCLVDLILILCGCFRDKSGLLLE